MSLKRSLVLALVSTCLAAVGYGCSSSTDENSGTVADAGVRRDTGPGGSSGTCNPRDVSGFVKPPYKPARAIKGACDSTLIQQFYEFCLADNAPENACANTFGQGKPANACALCLLTSESANAWGAIVDHDDTIAVNVGGCMELEGNRACAEASQTSEACQEDACRANCPVDTDAQLAQYAACQRTAAGEGCKAYADAETACIDAAVDGGAGSACWTWLRLGQNVTFKDIYLGVAPFFCGGTATDAGGG